MSGDLPDPGAGAPAPPPNPFYRTAAWLGGTAGALVLAALFAAPHARFGSSWGAVAMVVTAAGGTIGGLLGFGAWIALGHAERFDAESAAIETGQVIADWTIPAPEWNRFVEACLAANPRDAQVRAMLAPSASPVRVIILPRSIRWGDRHWLWGTATMVLTGSRFDEANGWLEVEVTAAALEATIARKIFVPVPEAERPRANEIALRLALPGG
ncbi:MAG TPA: hypothetical protein VHF22_00430 [Planctomycetota bacterium]|nr:hypothetical protein [Planctomycetota bacterium]